jgi:hypothetical protein
MLTRPQAGVLGFAAQAAPDPGSGWEDVYDSATRYTAIFQSPFAVGHCPHLGRHEIWLTMAAPSSLPGYTPLIPAA